MVEPAAPTAGASAVDPALQAEVERRVGRNLLLYQEIENALKEILFGSLIEGTREDLRERMAKRAAKVVRMNLGDVANAVFEDVFTPDSKERAAPAGPDEIWTSIQLRIAPPEGQPDAFEPFRQRCKAVVTQRNELVHHFLRRWTLDVATDSAAACSALDAQHVEASAFRDEAMAYVRAQEVERRKAAAYVSSPEFRQKLKDAIAQGKVIDVLLDAAANEHRADGWTLLTTAQNRVHERLPQEARSLKERLGREWLFKTMAMAPESFEARTEPLPNGAAGATRIVYRVLSEP
jgi:hypothetical protein